MMITYTSGDGPESRYLTVYSVQKPMTTHDLTDTVDFNTDTSTDNTSVSQGFQTSTNSPGSIKSQPDLKFLFSACVGQFPWNVLRKSLVTLSFVLLLIAYGVQIFLPISSFATNTEISAQNLHLFQANQDLSKLLFEVNREMFHVVDHLLQLNHNSTRDMSQLEFTWQMTDAAVMNAGKTSTKLLPSVSGAFELFRYRLANYRKSFNESTSPMVVVKLYLDLSEYIEHSCLSLGAPIHSRHIKHQHPISTVGLGLLSRGIGRRIAQMAYGNIYLRSTVGTINLSEFFELHHTSKESLTLAFELLPEAKLKYHELRAHMPDMTCAMDQLAADMTTCSKRRHDPDLLKLFQGAINEELSLLLQTKEFYSNILYHHISKYRSDHKRKDFTRITLTILSVVLACFFMSMVWLGQRPKNQQTTMTNEARLQAQTQQ